MHPFATLSYDPKVESVRLACIKHAASVRPEPGSNSPSKSQTDLNQSLKSIAIPCTSRMKFLTGSANGEPGSEGLPRHLTGTKHVSHK